MKIVYYLRSIGWLRSDDFDECDRVIVSLELARVFFHLVLYTTIQALAIAAKGAQKNTSHNDGRKQAINRNCASFPPVGYWPV